MQYVLYNCVMCQRYKWWENSNCVLSAIANDTHALLYAMAVKLAGEHIKRGSKTWRSHGIQPGWAQGHLSPTLGYETKGGGALTYAIVRFGTMVHIECRCYNWWDGVPWHHHNKYEGLNVIFTRTASVVCLCEITGCWWSKWEQMIVLLPSQELYSDVFGSIEGGRTD